MEEMIDGNRMQKVRGNVRARSEYRDDTCERGVFSSRLGKGRVLLRMAGDREEGYSALFYVHQVGEEQLCRGGGIGSAAGLEEGGF